MTLIFGKKICSGCREKLAELKKQGKKYKYYDLDALDSDDLAAAAYYGVLGVKQLPVIVEVADEK